MTYQKSLLALLLIFLVIALVFVVFNAGSSPGPKPGSKLQVTASFYPLYYFASRIGGTHADVYNLTPAGSEPHDFEPTIQDIAKIEKGNLLVVNGGVEAWADKVQSELAGTNVKVVVAGSALMNQQVTEQGQTATDPHVWLSPPLAKKEAANILGGFLAIDPANSAYYLSQAQSLDTQFDQLDSAFRLGLARCQLKDIVTSHAAFGYLASQYGLNQVAIAGLSPDAEPSVKGLANITNLVRQQHITYIFFESLVSPKLSETIASEVGARTLVLNPLEGLTRDQIRQGEDYFTVMRGNLANLETALQCTP